ncbi:hypothetical protein F5B21DRAFT_86142 [Xylaria acuta]|nr:hypothetical protein F5B21DRAFT_86142 [Xylaria acuta]
MALSLRTHASSIAGNALQKIQQYPLSTLSVLFYPWSTRSPVPFPRPKTQDPSPQSQKRLLDEFVLYSYIYLRTCMPPCILIRLEQRDLMGRQHPSTSMYVYLVMMTMPAWVPPASPLPGSMMLHGSLFPRSWDLDVSICTFFSASPVTPSMVRGDLLLHYHLGLDPALRRRLSPPLRQILNNLNIHSLPTMDKTGLLSACVAIILSSLPALAILIVTFPMLSWHCSDLWLSPSYLILRALDACSSQAQRHLLTQTWSLSGSHSAPPGIIAAGVLAIRLN